MTEEFGKVGEPDQATDFNQDTSDKGGEQDGVNITTEQLSALQKRDENAQKHIPQLEGENEKLRDQLSELQGKLDSATALDDVLNRLDNKDGATQTVDPDELVQRVEDRLQRKAQEDREQSNWDGVVANLTEHYGKWADADKAVLTKASELGMTMQEVTSLAKRTPDAFYKLFEMEKPTGPQQGVASQATNQISIINAPSHEEKRDRAHYSKMRRENPKKYWNVETQAQYRRDVHGA